MTETQAPYATTPSVTPCPYAGNCPPLALVDARIRRLTDKLTDAYTLIASLTMQVGERDQLIFSLQDRLEVVNGPEHE